MQNAVCPVLTRRFNHNNQTSLFHHTNANLCVVCVWKGGSGYGINQSQALVETDSQLIINFDMF